jgi:ribosomal protein L11 methylase PrmA
MFFLLVIPTIILIFGIIYLIQGPPYVPSDDESLAEMLALVKKYKHKRIIDLGSGDGKLVIALARQGCAVDGIELNPWLVWRSRRLIKRLGLKHTRIFWGSFWNTNFSQYDTIVIYGIKHIMEPLGNKLQQELQPHSYIITNFFVFPQWKPIDKMSRAKVYKI